MSTTTHALSLREAREEVAPLIEALRPHCERVEVAGSIRRGKPFVNDLEIVCVPKTVKLTAPKVTKPADLFADQVEVEETKVLRVPGFVNTVDGWQTDGMDLMDGKKFGSAWDGRYVRFFLASGTKVDLFITTLEQWGYLLFIRTGSADFTKMVKARGVQVGIRGEDGWPVRNGITLFFREESQWFDALGMHTPAPSDRELTADGISKWLK